MTSHAWTKSKPLRKEASRESIDDILSIFPKISWKWSCQSSYHLDKIVNYSTKVDCPRTELRNWTALLPPGKCEWTPVFRNIVYLFLWILRFLPNIYHDILKRMMACKIFSVLTFECRFEHYGQTGVLFAWVFLLPFNMPSLFQCKWSSVDDMVDENWCGARKGEMDSGNLQEQSRLRKVCNSIFTSLANWVFHDCSKSFTIEIS